MFGGKEDIRFRVFFDPPRATQSTNARILKRKDGSPFVGRTASGPGAKALKAWRTMVRTHRPQNLLEGPVRVEADIVYPWTSSHRKSERTGGLLAMSKRPDCDNLAKLLLDAMTKEGFWHDDGQVFDLRIRKFYGSDPGLECRIWECPAIERKDIFDAY